MHRHVQGRYGFVCNDQLGLDSQCAGYANALTLPATELVRIAVDGFGLESDPAQQFAGFLIGLLVWYPLNPCTQGHDVAHLLPGVERCKRVLEHHLYLTAKGPQFASCPAHELGAIQQDVTAIRLLQPDDATCQRAFARARLTHERQGALALHCQTDALDRCNGSLVFGKEAACASVGFLQ